ncbi:MAG: hypothetical protein AMJ84_00590 [Acidithiobacillales bacterium SM23_46]|jgi:hypothetical protein|nr:MAG: hypothetical protein AMS22_08330 [Thiotrichales bacterium SG8_50]KPK74160.1 MAG: hypothetical protein AMJ84_00590 [Acidithiobacillales bacterium SM23_46]KPL28693.1 MAG: hypothetical protein AMJ72_01820 [Acidithiobacillales bacterium SM1_46]
MKRTRSIRPVHSGSDRRSLLLSVALILVALSAPVLAAPMETEVPQLLARMETSGCEFYRNGTWANAAKARAHLERKYRAMRARDLIGTTEEFIERGATRSSMSGEAYRVRCDGEGAMESAAWFRQELQRLRAGSSSKP